MLMRNEERYKTKAEGLRMGLMGQKEMEAYVKRFEERGRAIASI
jgi:hypothetical protein